MKRKLRVLNFNIKGAKVPGRSSHQTQERSWHLLATYNADLALVQEAEHKAIPDWARERWSIVQGKPLRQSSNPAGWGSVIAAHPDLKMRSRDDHLQDPIVALTYDYSIFADIELPDGTMCVVASVHAPASILSDYLKLMESEGSLSEEEINSMAQPGDKAWAIDLFFSAISSRVINKRFIVGGDWNISRLFDLNSKTRKKGQLPSSTMFFTRAHDSGWFDCHGDKNEEQSFFRKDYLPHQLDHIFCDNNTHKKLVDCRVRADWIIHELSDHAPLVTDFKWD